MTPASKDSAPLPQFAQIALSLRFVSRAQIDECIDIQQKQRAMGLSPSLAAVFMQKSYLSVAQLGEVLRRVTGGNDVVAVPGYQIQAKLGEGGMGAVYKAVHKKLGRITALKLLKKDPQAGDEGAKRFIREARAAALIEHPSIVRVYDVGETAAHLYIAMELVEGGSARGILEREGSLSERAALSICADTAAALAAAARHGIVHRDVKPANILVAPSGAAKLCDLGIAKRLGGKDQSITRRGVLLGTPHYMAPEQASGEAVTPKSDLYALGASLHHLISGAPPFEAANQMDLLFMHVTMPVPSLKSLRPDISGRTAALAGRLMSKDPAARPADAAAVEREMREIMQSLPPEASRRQFVITPPAQAGGKGDEQTTRDGVDWDEAAGETRALSAAHDGDTQAEGKAPPARARVPVPLAAREAHSASPQPPPAPAPTAGPATVRMKPRPRPPKEGGAR